MNQKQLIDDLLKLFSKNKNPIRLNQIAKSLSIKSDSPEYIILKSVLIELCNQKILKKSTRRLYSLVDYENINTIEGVIKIINGAGVVKTQSKKYNKIRIKRRNLNTAFDGDKVLVKLSNSKTAKKIRGSVVQILQRNEKPIVGKIEFYDNIYFFIPDEDKYYVDFIINKDKVHSANDGDKVKVKLLFWDDPQKSPQAEVVEVLSDEKNVNDLKSELDSILEDYSLPFDFPKEVHKEAEAIKSPNTKSLLKERLDLRQETIITIDPEDAKDFDDALSLDFLDNGNQKLGVHIADVSYYVEQDSALDMEAYTRANSVYLVDRVVPMLPEKLSNNLCSLNPKRIRLAFTVFMEFNPKGNLVDYEIKESIIKSSKRFSYTQVQKIIEEGKGEHSELLINLHKLASLLRKKRFENGGVDFQTFEVKFILDENKNPIDIKLRQSTDATQLVEEFMLAANKTVAEHIKIISKKYKINPILPFVYRVHDDPMPDKLNDALQFLKSLGAKFNAKKKTSKDINRIVKQFDNRPEKPVIHNIMLRAMAKAVYSDKNIGHFGLGFKDYTHFTSPIRRYADLVVHRLLKEYNKSKPDMKRINSLHSYLNNACQHFSETERDSVDAERSSVKTIQTFIARKYLGQEIKGTISGITNFGLFVMLDEFYGDGLIHIRDLRDDYYYYDEKNHKLIGKRKKRIFKLGDKLKVRIIHVEIEHRKIDLEFIDKLK